MNQQQNYYQYQYANYQNFAYQKKLYNKQEKREIITAGFMLGATIIATLIMQVIAVSALSLLGLKGIYDDSSMFQNLYNVLAVHILSMLIPFGVMALILRKRFISPVVPTEKINKLQLFAWVSAGMALCLLANYVTSFVIGVFKQFGYTLTQNEYLEPSSMIECLALIISTVLVPAIIEELSLRCFGMGVLLRHGKVFAVVAISIVFGLLHGNIIQFVFAFLIGLVLGYITVRTDSIIPAMLIHGFNNGMSVVQTTITYLSNKDTANNVLTGIYLVWLALGLLGLIYLMVKKLLFPITPNAQKNPLALNFGKKILYILPGMAIPLLLLIYLSAQTIVKA